ncbi:hypothetical protein KC345_g3595 [Hortaea werneckii]|nr:hypothetical protein KC345_g3595 [Hortaea werneckii]
MIHKSLSRCDVPALAAAIASSARSSVMKHQEYVFRYLEQGPRLISNDPNTKKLNLSLLELCFVSPSLMHASLALALAYDRYRNGSRPNHHRAEEYHHWTRSATLFKKRLDQPIETKDKDPIWGTAATLALLSFSFRHGSPTPVVACAGSKREQCRPSGLATHG